MSTNPTNPFRDMIAGMKNPGLGRDHVVERYIDSGWRRESIPMSRAEAQRHLDFEVKRRQQQRQHLRITLIGLA